MRWSCPELSADFFCEGLSRGSFYSLYPDAGIHDDTCFTLGSTQHRSTGTKSPVSIGMFRSNLIENQAQHPLSEPPCRLHKGQEAQEECANHLPAALLDHPYSY